MAIARRRRVVLLVWAIVLSACLALYPSLKEVLSEPDYKIEGSQSAQVASLLSGRGFRAAGDEQDAIVFFSSQRRATDPVYRGVVERVLRAASASRGVVGLRGPYAAARGASQVSAVEHVAGRRASQVSPSQRVAARGASQVSAVEHAAGRGASQISAGGHAAVATLGLQGGDRERFKDAERLQSAVARASGAGVHAWLTGYSALSEDLSLTETSDSERGEMIGIPLALVILLFALGAVGAAVVPLLLAGSGLLLVYAVIALLGRIVEFDVFLMTVVTMIGLGIGIDYALFIVSRFREELARSTVAPRRERRRIADAVGVALATSGRTVLYSGAIVALSLSSLLVVRAPLFREFAIGAAVSVACTLAVALTALPALLAQLGPKINTGSLPARLQPADVREQAADGRGGWGRWAFAMMRRPGLVAIGVSLLLLAALSPVFGLRLGVALDMSAFSQTPSGRGAQVLAQSFRAGMTLPMEVVVTGEGASHGVSSGARGRSGMRAVDKHAALPASGGGVSRANRSGARASWMAAARTLTAELRADRRVAAVEPRTFPSGVLLTVILGIPVDSEAAAELVGHLRTRLAPALSTRFGARTLVGGWPAQAVDVIGESARKLPLVLAITLGIALLFLLVVLRSAVLPVKAVAMNLLATAATLGLVVLIFQQGHASALLGFTSPGFIQSYLPLCMFVLLFGLSMDYEVFLIRRIQESWRETSDNRLAVAVGVQHTARPISAAAAIMVVVFGSNVTANVLELKQFGFALAAAIAIDATLVRLVLVPALMCLLGARNWWLPAPLERLLPRLELD